MDNRLEILSMVLNAQARNDRYDMAEAIKDAQAAVEFVNSGGELPADLVGTSRSPDGW